MTWLHYAVGFKLSVLSIIKTNVVCRIVQCFAYFCYWRLSGSHQACHFEHLELVYADYQSNPHFVIRYGINYSVMVVAVQCIIGQKTITCFWALQIIGSE